MLQQSRISNPFQAYARDRAPDHAMTTPAAPTTDGILKAYFEDAGAQSTHKSRGKYVANNAKSAFDTDAQLRKYLHAHASEAVVLRRLLTFDGSQSWLSLIEDRKRFFEGLKELNAAPLLQKQFGEAVSGIYGVRLRLREAARADSPAFIPNRTPPPPPPHPMNDNEEFGFACWCLWQQYSTRVYLHSDVVKTFARRWDIDVADLFHYLIPHATARGYFTSPQLRRMELSIRDCMRHASVVCPVQVQVDPDSVQDQDPDQVDPASDQKLDAIQQRIAAECMASGVSYIVGGAGVGKTTLLAHMIDSIRNAATVSTAVKVVCMAFTHKARRCLQGKFAHVPALRQSCDDASVAVCTIHSYLYTLKRMLSDLFDQATLHACGISIVDARAGKHDDACARWSKADQQQQQQHRHDHLYVIDEASMVDMELLGQLAHIVNACRQMIPTFRYQFCIVGDDGQLPPIDRGEFFREIVEAGGSHVHRLTKCYRTNAVELFDACSGIRAGRLELGTGGGESWAVEMCADDDDIDAKLDAIIADNCRDEATARATQYIAWQNKDVRRINKRVQQELAQRGFVGPAKFTCGYQLFFVGDRVVYGGEPQADLNLSNAMTGTVVSTVVGSTANSAVGIVVRWDADDVTDTTLRYNSGVLKDLWLAYCMTVHKSQGSEYAQVVVPCFECAKMNRCLDRRWLYTAATRAKERTVVLCTQDIDAFVRKPCAPVPLSGLSFDNKDPQK